MNGVGVNTFDAPSVVGGTIFMSPILTTSLTPSVNDVMVKSDKVDDQNSSFGLYCSKSFSEIRWMEI